MSSQESLSPAVSSNVFETFAQAKQTLEKKIARYQPLDQNDDTAHFLQTFFKYLPADGQVNLAEDVYQRVDDEELRQLAESLESGLLRPMLAHGGTTPAITPSPRLGVEDSIDNLLSQDIHSVRRVDEQQLRDHCLKRDGYRCCVSKLWSWNYHQRPSSSAALLQAVHIIPFALGEFREDDRDKRYRHATLWVNLYRYFPGLRSRMNFFSEDVNREDNVFMMVDSLHSQFGGFHFVFESTQISNRYNLKVFPTFAGGYEGFLPRDRFVTFTSHDGRFPLPDPSLLAIHAAIGNILHLTGRGEKIELIRRDLGRMSGGLARDGSTRIGDLLSVSRLSLLASAANERPVLEEPKVKQRPTSPMLEGAENQRPTAG
ncbi:HNH endonuclease signature motif containing protein [Aspergillus alliaceus]|uniref:HNH endonuclease signature motif containing protein n=1 Tax=Petromyces alliaceus TaxID=209559 RepID=UPI0012A5A2C5|nr:uncharacterized protein BDW43DRAFT_163582 [Aspergillus alliaceus]KAB8230452.1 hypothetical protein BDW43DRAFT_163582 [Aspergillus alliaceus]